MYRAKKREIAIMYVRIAAIAVAFTLGACASTPTDPADPGAVADPYEGFNRQMFAFNNGVDKYALGPAAGVYKTVTPEFARDRIGDFLRNLRAPVIFVNDVLQAEPARAGDTFMRFTINTTVGIAGLWDAANQLGLEPHSEDFGQTLAVWGVDSGPYRQNPGHDAKAGKRKANLISREFKRGSKARFLPETGLSYSGVQRSLRRSTAQMPPRWQADSCTMTPAAGLRY